MLLTAMLKLTWRAFFYSCLLLLVNAQHYPVRTIYQGPPGLWLENLRVRNNGSILVTQLDQPRLLQFDPVPGSTTQLVHEFTGYEGLVGITETHRDVFAVVAGNFSLSTLAAEKGSWSIWTIDYRPTSCDKNGSPRISKLGDVPEAVLLNGVTYQSSSNALFIADSFLGVIFKMESATGAYSLALNNSLTNKVSPTVLEGINGIKYFNSSLYWTNSNGEFFARASVAADGNVIDGSSVVVSSPGVNFDDFDFAADGTAYLAGGFVEQIFRLRADGNFASIAGGLNSSEVAEPTAVAFEKKGRGTMYVTTGGGLGSPINGTVVVGGQLLAIDLK